MRKLMWLSALILALCAFRITGEDKTPASYSSDTSTVIEPGEADACRQDCADASEDFEECQTDCNEFG